MVTCYRHHLDRFDAYLQRVGVAGLGELSPALLSAFVAERSGAGLAKTTVREGCGVLRVFLRYAHREGLVRGDLWKTTERLNGIPIKSGSHFCSCFMVFLLGVYARLA